MMAMWMYIQGPNCLVEYNEIYNFPTYGIHISSEYAQKPSNTIVRFNTIHDYGSFYGGAGVQAGYEFGIIVAWGNGSQVYGNVLYRGRGGIGNNTTSSNTTIVNNTIYNMSGTTCCASPLIGGIETTPTTTVKNNALGAITGAPIGGNSESSVPATATNNACGSITTGCTIAFSPTVAWTDPTNANFTLKIGSNPLVDSGVALGAPYNTDIVSTTRPQPPGGSWDIGAYEGGGGVIPTCPSVSPALVASYAFEDSTNDSTGNNHTASLGSGWSYMAGKYGRGVVSTGVSGITVADHDALDMCGGFTFEGWINLPNTSGDYAFIVKNPDSKSFLFGSLTYTCGAGRPVGGYTQDPTQVGACYGTSLTTGSFQHLAVTYDSTLTSANVKLYVNGNPVTSADGTTLLDATTGTLQFCTSGFGETCPSGTIIDEIRIYNYARNAQQIVTDMETAIQVGVPTELKISGGTRRIGPGTTLRYGLKQ
jgi:Concanavalin A-like lectin/glucanases superfamily/Right handed beta helix region